MAKKRKNTKIFMLSIIIVMLIGSLGYLSYITFFRDARLKNLGYTYKEIQAFKSYGIEQQITGFNQSLVYSLRSKEFKQENLDYYLLFNSKMDLTIVVNNLAGDYTVNQVKELQALLSEEEVESLVEFDKISSITTFEKIYKKGYDLATSIKLTNDFPDTSLDSFLSLDVLSEPSNYLTYLANGYKDSDIITIYSLGDENFNLLKNIKHFSKLSELINTSGFNVKKLARYLMYIEKNPKSTCLNAINKVNKNNDATSEDKLNYSSFYTKTIIIDNNDIDVLINKSHQYSQEFVPSNLVEVPANYRYNNQKLTAETSDNFVKMSDACKAEVGKTLVAYNNYQSYTTIDTTYDMALINAYNNTANADLVATRAGASEHQTGLATDIAEKNSDPENFGDSKSSQWLKDNAYKFGFILRYPASKEFLTGFPKNDYHYRYVGTDIASVINRFNWCFEEYYYLFK